MSDYVIGRAAASALTLPHWDALSRGELAFQRCQECRAWHQPPRSLCRNCGGTSMAWETAPTEGGVYAAIQVHRTENPSLQAQVPYVIGVVRLTPDLAVLSFLEAVDDPGGGALTNRVALFLGEKSRQRDALIFEVR